MKRPFACVGFTSLLALMAAVYVFGEWSRPVAIGVLVLAMLSLLIPALRRVKLVPVTLFTCAAMLFSFSVGMERFNQSASLPEGEYPVSARVVSPPEKDGRNFVYELEILESPEVPALSGKVRAVSSKALAVQAYDQLTCKIQLYSPGDFSRMYYAAHRIDHFAYILIYDPVKIVHEPSRPWYYAFGSFRERLAETFYRLLPEKEAGLLCGMVLGARAQVSEEVEEAFRMAGVSHLLSVSGLHLSVLMQAFLAFLALFRLKGKLPLILAMPVVLAFMCLAGFSYSVLRSGIMFLLYLLAQLIGRRPDSLNSLGIAAFILCAANPFAAADTGFLLSCASTAGIILLQNRILLRIQPNLPLRWAVGLRGKLTAFILESFSITLSSMLLTLPISIVSFGTVSTVSVFSNLLMVLPASALLSAGALTCLTGVLCLPAALPFGFAAGLLAKYEISVSEWLGALPFAVVNTSYLFITLWLAAVLFLTGTAMLFSTRKRLLPRVALISAALLLVCIPVQAAAGQKLVTVSSFYSEGEIRVAASCQGSGKMLLGEAPSMYVQQQMALGSLEKESEVLDSRVHLVGEADGAVFLEVDGVSMLLCGEDCNVEELPQAWRSPEFLWLLEEPRHAELLSAEIIICFCEEPDGLTYETLYTTERYGRFVLSVETDGIVRIGREW